MGRTWLRAAGQYGIPASFVVRDGKIAWIGHPMRLDGPLADVVAGRAPAKPKADAAAMDAFVKIMGLMEAKQWKGVVEAVDEASASNPSFAVAASGCKFAALCSMGEVDAAVAFGRASPPLEPSDAAGLVYA